MTDDEQPAGSPSAGLNQAAIDWAWAQPVANNPGARVVLMAVAHRVDETWEWTASQEEVAMEAMVPARSMRRYLDQLEEGGFIVRLKRLDEKGLRLPCVFRLNPSSEPTAKLAAGSSATPAANLASGSDLGECPTAILAVGGDIQRPIWPLDERSGSSEPTANMAVGQQEHQADDPTAKLATGSDQPEHPTAKLAVGQEGLWSTSSGGENPSSEPTAKLAAGQIPDKRSSSSSEKKNKKKPLSSEIRADVEQLCSRLLSWLAKNDIRQRPEAISDDWRTAARLLLDKDGVLLDEALAVLDWSQRDQFWHKNIHSMPTFRDKYGRLEIKSRGVRGDTSQAATGTTGQRPDRLPPRVGGYEKAKNFGKRGQS